MNGYEAVAKILKMEGVEWLACFPSNPLIEAAAREGIRPIVFRQERGGVMAADGFSRMNNGRRFGVFASQGGPGVENSFGGIAQAWGDAVPVLFLPDGPGTDRTDVPPSFRAPYNYQYITKWAEAVNRPDRVVSLMRRAIHALKNGRPGPVLLELHRDAMAGEVTNLDTYKSPKAMRVAPSQSDIKDAVTELLRARRPVIWAGQGVLYAEATEELRELAELSQIPVITTMPGKSAIDEGHPLALGAANRTAPLAVWKWLKESDVLFAIGSSLTITNYGITIPPGKLMIHSTNHAPDINKDYAIDIPLLGDAKLVLQMMIEEVKAQLGERGRRDQTAIQDEIAAVKKRWREEWMPLLTSDAVPINPYRLIYEITKAIDLRRTTLTHDAGHPRDQIMPFYPATVPHSYIGWGKTTHLGYGLPLMIGAKLAFPERFCMNVMGDAAFGMSGLDLETAVRAGVPITTVVLNNGTMGGYSRSLPTAMGQYGAGRMSGDYARIAEGLGAVGIRVEHPAEIGPAVERARRLNEEGRCVLLDVYTQEENKMSIYPFSTL
jgi:thiamine pyrophosphate-dependent acetolactate synthase large subunit-like protein